MKRLILLAIASLCATAAWATPPQITPPPVNGQIAANPSATRSALGLSPNAWTGSASDLSTGTLGAARLPALTGDITTSAGSAATTLKATGTAGTYTKVTTDANGRVSSGAALGSGDVTGALGYTPLNPGTTNTITALQTLSSGANGTLFNATGSNGFQIGGNSVITPLDGGAAYQTTLSVDLSTLPNDTRYHQLYAILSPSVNTSKTWENFNSMVNVNGPGIQSSEDNVIHGFLTFNSGSQSTAGGNEVFEASFGNSGIVAAGSDYLAAATNFSTGTLANYTAFNALIVNQNTTASSLGNYIAYQCSTPGTTGGGTLPTTDYCLKNPDVNGSISTAGNVIIGSVGISSDQLHIVSPNSTGSVMLQLVNSGNANIVRVSSNGLISFGQAGVNAGNITMAGATSGIGELQPPAVAANFNWFLPGQTGTIALDLTSTTNNIGGSALLAGACASATQAVASAATTMVAVASPNTYPGDGIYWTAYVSSAGNVTIKVCAAVAATPTTSTYNIRVIQ